MDRFEAMRTLIAAVDGGSLSEASRESGVPLPTVSRRVSDLEARPPNGVAAAKPPVRCSPQAQLTDPGESVGIDRAPFLARSATRIRAIEWCKNVTELRRELKKIIVGDVTTRSSEE